MQVHSVSTSAKQAAMHVIASLAAGVEDTVCLLSGGSALDIVEYLDAAYSGECRTIFMMGDERVSRESTVNNYLQLVSRYGSQQVAKHVIPTVPLVNESPELFAARIENIFLQLLSNLKNPKIIAVLGVGMDGHTSGIFPMNKETFGAVYRDDRTYVSIPAEGLRIDPRASFTPSWLLTNVDEIIGYVTGESKLSILQNLLNESKEIHERPAEVIKQHRNAHLYTDLSI